MSSSFTNSIELLLKLPAEVANSRLLARLIGETMTLRQELKSLVSRDAARRSHELLSLREAARRLGVDRGTTLAELVAQKRLRIVHVNGRPRIPADEVKRLASEGFDTSSAPAKVEGPTPKPAVGVGAAIRGIKL